MTREASDLCTGRGEDAPQRIGNAICVRGILTTSTRDRFFALRPKRGDIVVTSGSGGDIAAAMDIGDKIYRNDILVVVDDLCGSACAYFIALGGKRLSIYKNGLLGFHGGPIPENEIMAIPNLSNKDRKKIIFDNERFKKFFKRRGLQIRLTNEIPEESKNNGTDWSVNMWVRWPYEFEKFGFNGLVFCAGKYCQKR